MARLSTARQTHSNVSPCVPVSLLPCITVALYTCQHPACYSSQHGWTSFATFAYSPVPLYTRIRVAMHPCIHPPHSPAMLHRIPHVPPFPCFLASPSPCCTGGPDRQNQPYLRPLLAHFDLRTDVAPARSVDIALCSPVSGSTCFPVPRFQEEQW